MGQQNDDTYIGMESFDEPDLPSAVSETLTASGDPITKDTSGMVFGVPPVD